MNKEGGEKEIEKQQKKKKARALINKNREVLYIYLPHSSMEKQPLHIISFRLTKIAPRSTGRAEIKGGDIVDQNLDMMGHLFLHEVAFEHPASQAKSYTLLSKMEKATEGVSLNEGSVDPAVLW